MGRLRLDGAELHYDLAGPRRAGAAAIVLVHGGCCTGRDWSPQAEALQGEFEVLTPDLRGHGRSTGASQALDIARWAADLNALVEALALPPAVLVGHSLGARIVAEAAGRRPSQVAGLVLLDGSRTVGGFAATQPSRLQPPEPSRSLAEILDRTVGPHAHDEVRRHVVETMSAAPPEVKAASVRALEDWDRHRADAAFAGLAPALPVLAIQSTYHDRFTPRRSLRSATETTPYLDFLRQARPGIEVAILSDTGHFSMLERPGLVTDLVRALALRTSAPAASR